VTYVRNITDIEDKIIRRALENGDHHPALTDEMIAEMHRDFDALGVQRRPPRAARHRLRAADAGHDRTLQDKGLAYQAAAMAT
jgi:cysteinyl-tRNA synthetase